MLEWLNPLYLDVDYQSQVQQEFEDSSEIQLKNFLKVTPLLNLFISPSLSCSLSLLVDSVSLYRRRSLRR